MGTKSGFSISVVAALAVMGGLFWFLHARIGGQRVAIVSEQVIPVNYSPAIRDTEVKSRRDEKPRHEKPPVIPTPHFSPRPTDGGGPGPVILVDAIFRGTEPRRITPTTGQGGFDTDAAPLVRIEPEYPIRATQRGIEGWVVVQFTITPIGTVRDATVVEASPEGVFDDAAVRAVLRWKYSPKIVQGAAVERRGVRVRLRFALDGQ